MTDQTTPNSLNPSNHDATVAVPAGPLGALLATACSYASVLHETQNPEHQSETAHMLMAVQAVCDVLDPTAYAQLCDAMELPLAFRDPVSLLTSAPVSLAPAPSPLVS